MIILYELCTVAGTVTEISVSDGTVVSWSPPVPPNGIILYYNIRITRTDNGELVRSIEELNVLTIDVSDYIDIDTQYSKSVSNSIFGAAVLYMLLSIEMCKFRHPTRFLKLYTQMFLFLCASPSTFFGQHGVRMYVLIS